MPVLTIRSNNPTFSPASPGHAWVEVLHDDGTVESFGYYPQTGGMGNLDGPGTVRVGIDSTRVADKISQDIFITEAEYQKLKEFVSTSEEGSYSLDGIGINDQVGTWNCLTWARDAIRHMGVEVQVPILVIVP